MRYLIILILILSFLVPQVVVAQDENPLDPSRTSGAVKRVLYKVQLLRNRGETDEARKTLRKHLADHPDQDHALLEFHLGQVLAQQDSMQASVDAFEKAVTLEPDLEPAWRNLGEVSYGLGLYGQAADAFGQAWRLDPESPGELRYFQGVALLQAGRAAESLDVLEGLINVTAGPAELAWYRALISAAVEAGQVDRITSMVEDMTTLYPEVVEAWTLAYQQAGAALDYPRAARNLTVVGYLRPLSRDERIQLGDLCLAAEAPVRAARHYSAVIDSFPEPVTASDLDRLVSAWLAADRPVEALGVLDRRLELAPSARIWRLKGELLYGEEDFQRAREAFAQASALDPDNAELQLLQGYCLIELDRPDEAVRALDAAARDPRYEPRAREALTFLRELGE